MLAVTVTPAKISYLRMLPPETSRQFSKSIRSTPIKTCKTGRFLKSVRCISLELVQEEEEQQQQQVNSGILCEPCKGKGWLVCDFCKGQKTNVKADNKRIYRRCPSCRAIGYVLCSQCKVFKCVTFPNYDDGEELSF